MFYGETKTSLKYKKRAGIYSNSTGTNTFDPKTCRAYSYDWWRYVDKIKGKVVFNNYSYSPTTSGHQSRTRSLLKELKIEIDCFVSVRSGLQAFEREALKPVYREMYETEVAINRKGARESTKKQGAEFIVSCKERINLYRSLGAKFSRKEQAELKRNVLESEQKRLEQLRKERAEKPARSYSNLVKTASTFEIVM